jgi:hypothetical protein
MPRYRIRRRRVRAISAYQTLGAEGQTVVGFTVHRENGTHLYFETRDKRAFALVFSHLAKTSTKDVITTALACAPLGLRRGLRLDLGWPLTSETP